MDIKKIEELERFEKLVWKLHGGYYVGYPQRDFVFEKSIDDKVLYYLKLGLTVEDLDFKVKKMEERREAERQERLREEKERHEKEKK